MKLIKRKQLIICILLLVITLSIGIFAYISRNANKTSLNNEHNNSPTKYLDNNGEAVSGEFKSKTHEQVLAELQKAQVSVTDKVSSNITFPNGTKGSIGSWVVENIISNNVIMQCEIYKDNILIAKSVPIYPNEHINSINLLESLQSGSYDVLAYINYFNENTKEYISKAGYKIKLDVK